MISCKDVRQPASGSQREAGTRTYKLRSIGSMGVCAVLYIHVRCRRKQFTLAISDLLMSSCKCLSEHLKLKFYRVCNCISSRSKGANSELTTVE